MRKLKTTMFGLGMLIALAFPAMAGAHVEMSPSEAPAGKPVNLSFEIPHGCDGAATTSIVVQIPKGAQDVTATAIEGWKAKTTPDTLTWTGGPLPDHQTEDFPFRATLYGKKGDVVMFKTIQKCQGGAETAWIQAEQGGVEPEHPAPAVTLTSTAAVPAADMQAADDQAANEGAAETGEPTASAANVDDSKSDDDGGDGKTLILIIIAGLAIGTVAGIVVRARRNQ
ncbi:MAG: YcnI family protein [Solirubrobacterales bacterium]|nr:YcnI family protein [Solirubrobacterales bacterium]MCB0861359.1 YcnI family protein [Solirubrobacterales bacterium]